MLDRNIPFYNVILKCGNYIDSEIILPKGYYFRNYQPGDERAWAQLEYEIGDFKTVDMAEEYFVSNYCQDINDIRDRCARECWKFFRSGMNFLYIYIRSPGVILRFCYMSAWDFSCR